MDIYVGNLPYSVDDNTLQDLFSAHGTVTSSRVIMDRMTGRSKGFGFVEMPDKAEADAAINALNGNDCDGRALRVNESQPKPRNSGGGGGYGGGGGGGGYGGGGGGGGGRRDNRW
ncbi:MAG: RNA-binding protein [Kiritimatiellia bacterium]|jgi:RNA recognition motif-containing protein|nr:RNA-binding protein [Kiritimatiellia bacterium]MDP6809484.1 RNA-binding protein [Kiritimatiellia bacterium]MDP7023839.1 RNA-binding protein [Kiritimatiellia bacterium]